MVLLFSANARASELSYSIFLEPARILYQFMSVQSEPGTVAGTFVRHGKNYTCFDNPQATNGLSRYRCDITFVIDQNSQGVTKDQLQKVKAGKPEVPPSNYGTDADLLSVLLNDPNEDSRLDFSPEFSKQLFTSLNDNPADPNHKKGAQVNCVKYLTPESYACRMFVLWKTGAVATVQ